jgi:DNA invertase Pin-like site-specific DNA recombinase
VHQLVLLTFVGPLPEGQEVRHLNGDRSDNRLENLCYGTRKENANDAVEHGTQPHGETHGRCKLAEEQVREIIRLAAEQGVRGTEIANRFGVSESLICMILNNQSWTHLPRPEQWAAKQRKRGISYAKITREQAQEIRKLYAEGWLQRELGVKFGVCQANISKILSGKSWPDPQ